MSKLTDTLSSISGGAIRHCWRQWQALFDGPAPAPAGAATMIDPEALVAASLALRESELRLDDMLLCMAGDSRLLSVQRMKSVLRAFPARLSVDLAWFAAAAVRAGDARWRALATQAPGEQRGRPGKSMPSLSVRGESAFVFRMRSGLGVGIKADLVGCLAGMKGVTNHHAGGLSTSELASVLSYSATATRQALDEMVRAEVVSRLEGRPARHRLGNIYFQSFERGAPPSTAAAVPPWGYWSQIYAILVACEELLSDPEILDLPEVVQASQLRDLAERFSPCWSWFGVEPIDARAFPGTRFFDAFRQSLDRTLEGIA